MTAVLVVPAAAGDTGPAIRLVVAVDSGEGVWHRATLRCEPTGGTLPGRRRACATLHRLGPKAFAPVPADVMCTEQYGGPQRARVTGTWHGRAVRASFTRTDGCQIARWDAIVPVLPDLH